MKTALICFKCENLVRFSETYAMKISHYVRQYIKRDDADPVFMGVGKEEVKVRVCKKCTKKAGYKVKVVKRSIK